MTPGEFLSHLWPEKPAALYVLLWTLQDKRSHWFQDVAKAGESAAAAKDRDVYVGVGLSKADHGPARRCKSEEVSGICGIGTDLDLKSDAHRKQLPATIPDALTILPPSMPPSIVVSTGNGVHPWWLLKEPCIFETEDERSHVARLAARWHTMLRLNSAAHGWAYDRLSDLARVLRIPGTINHQDSANPKEVTVLSSTDRRYNLSDFEEFLDEAGIPDPEAEDKAAREWAEQFADKPLVIDPNARIPQEMLDGWMAADMRFRNTWLRQRHDLKDQSQSGDDLALADFGVDAGLTEQQIVDLIVHHRAGSRQKVRNRLDYYQRTIAKASRRNTDLIAQLTAPLPAAPGVSGPAPATGTLAPAGAQGAPREAGPGNPASPDPAAERASLCQRISQILGIRIRRLVKLTGKDPTYHMELEEGKIEFETVGKFISQESVRLAIAGKIGRLIPKTKANAWEQIAQAMLNACEIEDGGQETEWEGAAVIYIRNYLSETGFIGSVESQQLQNQRKPMLLDDQIAICAGDLQMHANKSTAQNLSVKRIVSMLQVVGAAPKRHRGAKFKEQSRRLLPVDQFDPAEYSPRKTEEPDGRSESREAR